MKTAVVFLTTTPKAGTIDFAALVKEQRNADVFIMADTDERILMGHSDVTTIQIADSECVQHGYFNSMHLPTTHIKKNPVAFDKFLYYFCKLDKMYDYVWFFEDDVFIPSVDTLKYLNDKYNSNDLVIANNFCKSDSILDWHWKHIFNKVGIEPPYYYSMACAGGLSRKMLQTIKQYVDKQKTLFFLEVMLNTIAMKNNLSICTPLELKTIVWQGRWDLDEFLLLPNNVFHPKKNIDEHKKYRVEIADAISRAHVPEDNLPDFVKKAM